MPRKGNSRYYTVLGFEKGEEPTLGEIKKAYKTLALIFHPDKNKSRAKPMAEKKFKEAQTAYEELQKKFEGNDSDSDSNEESGSGSGSGSDDDETAPQKERKAVYRRGIKKYALWHRNGERNLELGQAKPPAEVVADIDTLIKGRGGVGARRYDKDTHTAMFGDCGVRGLPDMRIPEEKFLQLCALRRHYEYKGRQHVRQVFFDADNMMEEAQQATHRDSAFKGLLPSCNLINEEGKVQNVCLWYRVSPYVLEFVVVDARQVASAASVVAAAAEGDILHLDQWLIQLAEYEADRSGLDTGTHLCGFGGITTTELGDHIVTWFERCVDRCGRIQQYIELKEKKKQSAHAFKNYIPSLLKRLLTAGVVFNAFKKTVSGKIDVRRH